MTALVVAGVIVSGTGCWAVAKVVDISTMPPVSRTKPIEAFAPAGQQLPPVVDVPATATTPATP